MMKPYQVYYCLLFRRICKTHISSFPIIDRPQSRFLAKDTTIEVSLRFRLLFLHFGLPTTSTVDMKSTFWLRIQYSTFLSFGLCVYSLLHRFFGTLLEAMEPWQLVLPPQSHSTDSSSPRLGSTLLPITWSVSWISWELSCIYQDPSWD